MALLGCVSTLSFNLFFPPPPTHLFTVDTSLVLTSELVQHTHHQKTRIEKIVCVHLELYVHTHEVVRDGYCGERYAQPMNINMNSVITFIWGHIPPLLCCVQQLIGPGGNTPSHTRTDTHTWLPCCVASATKPWIYVQKGNTGSFYEFSLSIHASFSSFLSIC